MSRLERHRAMALALRLIGHRAKLSIVHAATDVRPETLRRLYREVHGQAPHGGPLATGVGTVLKTRVQQAQASLFAGLYVACRGYVLDRSVDYAALAHAYALYLALVPGDAGPPLPFNLAWAVATDLRCGQATLAPCPRCAVRYLAMRTGTMGLRCPICALYARA